MDYREELIDTVIEQIREDLAVNDTSAIYEMLDRCVDVRDLEHFLKEEVSIDLRERWGLDSSPDYIYEA